MFKKFGGLLYHLMLLYGNFLVYNPASYIAWAILGIFAVYYIPDSLNSSKEMEFIARLFLISFLAALHGISIKIAIKKKKASKNED